MLNNFLAMKVTSNERNNNVSGLIYIILGLIVIFLFYWKFSVFNYQINSDNAIHILMIENSFFPYDLYYWGQDRLGSLIPYVGRIFYHIGFNSLSASAMSQGFLLLLSCYFLSYDLKNYLLIVGLTIFVLLPIYPFLNQVQIGHPVLGQILFISLFMFLYYNKSNSSNLWSFLFSLTLVLSLWASELSLGIIFSFLFIEYKNIIKAKKWRLIYNAVGIFIGLLFVVYAKNNADRVSEYNGIFASLISTLNSLKFHFSELVDMLQFITNKPFNSFLLYVVLLWLGFLIYITIIYKVKLVSKTKVLLLGSLATYLMVHMSNWNDIMGRPLHHFTPAYLLFIISLLYWTYDIMKWRKNPYLNGVLYAVFSIHLFSSIYYISMFSQNVADRISRNDVITLMDVAVNDYGLDNFTVIGSYWNSYIFDALSPDVRGIPHQGGHMRNSRYTPYAMDKANFILIGNNWLQNFPDTIFQYNHQLIRSSLPDTLSNTSYAIYRSIKNE